MVAAATVVVAAATVAVAAATVVVVVAVMVRLAMNVEIVFQAMPTFSKVPMEATEAVAAIYSMILTRSMWLHYALVHPCSRTSTPSRH